MTVDVAEHFEGLIHPDVHQGSPPMCGACEEMVEADSAVTAYWSNADYGPGETDGSRIARTYHAECDRRLIRFPCAGVTEVLFEAVIDLDGRLDDVAILDVSTSEDGTPWDPPSMFRLFFGADVDEYLTLDDMDIVTPIGPEDVYDLITERGVDPRELVDEEGYVTADEDELAALRETFWDELEAEYESMGGDETFKNN